MKKINDLMKELGFNDKAPKATGEAFIKHLIKSSVGINVTTPSEKKQIEDSKNVHMFKEQLTFDDFIKQTKDKKAVS